MRYAKILYADDDHESIGTLFKLRTPPLFLGLLLGIVISFVVSNFEEVLAHNVQVAFFLPFIVYIADSIGGQTGTIYSRDLKSGRAKFSTYLYKEFILGITFGAIFAIFAGIVSLLWLQNNKLSASIAIATFLTVSLAPLIALLVTQYYQIKRKDPATATGPIATVIQDMASVIIYGLVCSLILL